MKTPLSSQGFITLASLPERRNFRGEGLAIGCLLPPFTSFALGTSLFTLCPQSQCPSLPFPLPPSSTFCGVLIPRGASYLPDDLVPTASLLHLSPFSRFLHSRPYRQCFPPLGWVWSGISQICRRLSFSLGWICHLLHWIRCPDWFLWLVFSPFSCFVSWFLFFLCLGLLVLLFFTLYCRSVGATYVLVFSSIIA